MFFIVIIFSPIGANNQEYGASEIDDQNKTENFGIIQLLNKLATLEINILNGRIEDLDNLIGQTRKVLEKNKKIQKKYIRK